MTRHPTARRVHREATAPDDVFVAGVLETTAWAREHSRKILIGGAIAAVVIIGTLLFLMNRQQKERDSIAQLTQVRAIALSGNAEAAIPSLQQFISDFGGTRAENEARLLLGAAFLDAGQQQNAIETVSGLTRKLDTDVGVNAANLTAAAHEAAGEPGRAEEILLRVGEGGRFLFQRQEALDNVARIRLARGDLAGGVAMYERLVEMTPETAAERQVYELRLGEARALAAAGAAASSAAGTQTPAAPAAGTAQPPAAPGTGG